MWQLMYLGEFFSASRIYETKPYFPSFLPIFPLPPTRATLPVSDPTSALSCLPRQNSYVKQKQKH